VVAGVGCRVDAVEVHNPKGRRRVLMSVAIVLALTDVNVALVTLSVIGIAATIFLVNRRSGPR
jgi:hypothetical protein